MRGAGESGDFTAIPDDSNEWKEGDDESGRRLTKPEPGDNKKPNTGFMETSPSTHKT
jgi:hypothetical protein